MLHDHRLATPRLSPWEGKMPSKPSREHYQKASFLCTPHSTQERGCRACHTPFQSPGSVLRDKEGSSCHREALCHPLSPSAGTAGTDPSGDSQAHWGTWLLHAAQAKASGRQEGLPQPLCGQHPHAGDQETKKGNQAGMEVVGHLGAEESRRGISCRGSQRALFCLQTTVLRSTS